MNLKSRIALRSAGRLSVKIVVVISAALGGSALVSSSVFASLTATATATTSVTTGTLKLTQTATGASGGFATAITAMAPGDTINRYVDLLNGGTLNALTPTLRIAGSGANALTTDGTAGLQVSIKACPLPGVWTQGTGICTGATETTVLASTSALTLASDTAITLASNLAAATSSLKISISLPAGTEITTNGTLPGGTIQGLTTTLTWTFTETQRTATTTNS